MKRPNRENYENGVYGHIKYVNRLEKYCTHIEKENQALQLLQPAVSGRSEQLKCQCKKAKFTRTVDADFNPLCGRCGKAL
jgi:hypothetical protein